MKNLMKSDREYARWITELAQRYRSSQVKAAIKVNEEMLHFYWSVGGDIEKRQYENRYGSHFYENIQTKPLESLLNTFLTMVEFYFHGKSTLVVNR